MISREMLKRAGVELKLVSWNPRRYDIQPSIEVFYKPWGKIIMADGFDGYPMIHSSALHGWVLAREFDLPYGPQRAPRNS